MELSFEFGWNDDGFYDSIWRVSLAAEEQAPHMTDRDLLAALASRVRTLLTHDNFPGWGMDECMESLAESLQRRVEAIRSGA